MKFRKLDDWGSIWPIVIVVICIAIAGFVILVLGEILEPVTNFVGLEDSNVDSDISSPRLTMRTFFNLIWPRGVMIVLLIGLIGGMLMYYQKRRYNT